VFDADFRAYPRQLTELGAAFATGRVAVGISRRFFVPSLCLALLGFSASVIVSAEEKKPVDDGITLLGEEIPGGFLKIEGIKGVGVYPDLFYEAAAASNTEINFRYVPWGRAFRKVERSTNLLTFPLTRLPEREPRYRWLVSLDRDEIVFLTTGAPINNLDEAKRLRRILVWEGSSMEIFLTQNGFSNLLRVAKAQSILRMLINGRADAWFTVRPEESATFSVDGKPVELVAGDVVNTESVWLVGGKSFKYTEDTRRFTQNVRMLVEKGRLKELKAKYGISRN